uniref:RNA polymerase II associated protein 1 n=1 Tax=Echeneis naucrates TaxID=173247 RepID=A0A665VT34_ECHNA
MLRRPKPTDSEADLLREQEQFLTSGVPSAANVVRRPDKRRGEAGGGGGLTGSSAGSQKDVVTIDDLPDQLPSLTPAPPKKSRFKASRVTFEDEDAEERLDRHDTHISAVLSKIVVSSSCKVEPKLSSQKESAFYSLCVLEPPSVSGPRLVSGHGLGGPGSSRDTMRIHMENQAKIQEMSQSEILEEQKKLLSQLGSAAVCKVDLLVKPKKEWVHMDKLEPEKLKWMRDLPAPRKKDTKKAMQARFDFSGSLIPPTEDLPTHLGLHHHGEEPERAGYSLQELFLLSRSQVIQQRSLALSTLANILSKARAGEFTSVLKGNVMATLLDAGLLFLLRFALDDSVEGVMSAAAHALKALLVCTEDEECLDYTFSWFHGLASFPLLPSAPEEEDEEDEELDESMKQTAKEKEERKSDHDVARQDVVKGLLKIKLLPRLRYILEVIRPSPRVVQDILDILIRIARHSSNVFCSQVLGCPRLMETVMSEFLPTSWTAPASPLPHSVYGFPLANAMKFLRVLATSGRHACARLLNSLGVRERLSCLLGAEPPELLLEPAEALRITTEAYRFWAVAAGYGQACNLYIDLYSALMKALQSVHQAVNPSDPFLSLQLQRVLALLSLLTQVTHTAGCHQELQAGMVSSQGEECLPPPEVSWGHVTGLQASLVGHLKGFVKSLDNPVERDCSLALIPAYLVYLEAYYRQLTKQVHMDTLQELEQLTSEVLFPLFSHHVVQSLMKNLRSSSVVCNVQSGHQDPETTPNLPGLVCAGWRDRPGLVVPSSPFPLLTGLGLLVQTITGIHKGLSCKVRPPGETVIKLFFFHLTEIDFYLFFFFVSPQVPVEPEIARYASLYHQVALVLLPWLLPGSEYLTHELLCTILFNKDFISEGHSGGPEAVELGELKLHEGTPHHPSPSLQTVGALLREACVQLPSIRGCFLTHLAHLESSVLVSQDALLGRNPWINSHLLPELTGPILPSDWSFLPLISLYERAGVSEGGGLAVKELPQGALQVVTHCLQWLLLLEVWREEALKVIPPVAKLARLSCVFLSSSDLFLERPVQKLTWGLFRLHSRLDSLDLNIPPPGLASFQDLYSSLLAQYEAVSFGDQLFGCWVLLPLQRRYSATMRLAVFGEHVGMLRSLGVTLEQLSIPLKRFTSPPEDSLPLLRLYFRSLVTGTLKHCWCPVLYVVALSHVNSFVFSQDAAAQEVEAARHSMLRKVYYLTDEVLRNHLLLFHLPQQHSELGFDMYEQLPPIRAKRLESVLRLQDSNDCKGD